jgi:hypothetical protein
MQGNSEFCTTAAGLVHRLARSEDVAAAPLQRFSR